MAQAPGLGIGWWLFSRSQPRVTRQIAHSPKSNIPATQVPMPTRMSVSEIDTSATSTGQPYANQQVRICPLKCDSS